MTEFHKEKEAVGEVETALLDAELFLKYGSPDRAMKRLKTALERSPRSIPLREKMREVAATHKHPEEAARHCLALASLYIERDNLDARTIVCSKRNNSTIASRSSPAWKRFGVRATLSYSHSRPRKPSPDVRSLRSLSPATYR